jgi:hypothetical protein
MDQISRPLSGCVLFRSQARLGASEFIRSLPSDTECVFNLKVRCFSQAELRSAAVTTGVSTSGAAMAYIFLFISMFVELRRKSHYP